MDAKWTDAGKVLALKSDFKLVGLNNVSAGAPAAPEEGEPWYDSTNDIIGWYDGSDWYSGLKASSVTIVDGSWIGFGAAAGRMEFDDQSPDEINFQACNVAIGDITPAGLFHTATGNAANSSYFDTYDDGATYSYLYFRKSDSDTIGTAAETDDTDVLGQLSFQGVSSTPGFGHGAIIQAYQDGASGASTIPTNLALFTYSNSAANSNQLVLHNDGRIGVGLATPEGILHTVKSNATNSTFFDTYDDGATYSYQYFRKSDSDTVGTKAETDNADVLGQISFQGVNSSSAFAHGAIIQAVQDGSAGASTVPTNLALYTYSNSSANSNQLVLHNDGKIGVNTATPNEKFDIAGYLMAYTLRGYASLRNGTIRYKDDADVYVPANVMNVKDKIAFWDSELTYTCQNLAASTWSYIYVDYSAITSGTAITNSEITDSTTAPTYDATYKQWSNADDDRCIGAVLCDGTTDILKFAWTKSNGTYMWDVPIEEINDTVQAAFADADLTTSVPAFEDLFVHFSAIVTGDQSTSANCYSGFRTKGMANEIIIGSNLWDSDQGGSDPILYHYFSLVTDTSQVIEYIMYGSTNPLVVNVMGFDLSI